MLRENDADKTPIRPPSQSAMEAFQASSDFLSGNVPKAPRTPQDIGLKPRFDPRKKP